ncbi:MAG: cobalt-zinc-cadmium efflux system membrane fusion protein [Myxococcota bacterium]|jgi:cobalt-zinc-cadmium efflux system membrane fusion protein
MSARRFLLPLLLTALVGCTDPTQAGHGHGDNGHAAHDDSHDSIAITRWTDTHELFVELDAPVAGQPFSYHAHVTRLADNVPATSGSLTFRFVGMTGQPVSHTDDTVARPGIFAAQANAPAQGVYSLVLTYDNGAERSEWDAGTVTIGNDHPVAHDGEDEGEIAFLKETQWQIPFTTATAQTLQLSPTIETAAIAKAAPASTTVVAAPSDGLLVWADGLPVVGRRVVRGEPLAAIVPASMADSWSRLQADVSTARVDSELAERELARVEALSERDLLPARRLDEARAGAERARTEVRATRRRVSTLTSSGAGAIPITAPADGIIVSVGGDHGSEISAGSPLVSVATTRALLLEGHVHSRTASQLGTVSTVAVHRGDWPVPRILSNPHVLTDQLVFDPHTLSAPISVLVDDGGGLLVGDLVSLSLGIGTPTPRLAIPRSAVVEASGTDIVFVQKTGESFTRRRVVLGLADPTHVEVLSGIESGERVVTEGGFDVYVAALSGSLESHRH